MGQQGRRPANEQPEGHDLVAREDGSELPTWSNRRLRMRHEVPSFRRPHPGVDLLPGLSTGLVNTAPLLPWLAEATTATVAVNPHLTVGVSSDGVERREQGEVRNAFGVFDKSR